MSNESPSTSSGNGVAKPNGRAKVPERRTFTDEQKRPFVARVRKGEAVQVVADSVPVAHSVLRRWLKAAGVATPKEKAAAKAKAKKSKAKVATLKRYTEAQQADAVQRVLKGEKIRKVADQMGATPTSVRDWVKRFKSQNRIEMTSRPSMPVSIAVRDAILYLKHTKVAIYALLQSGEIKEFEEYHLNTLAALKLLQGISLP